MCWTTDKCITKILLLVFPCLWALMAYDAVFITTCIFRWLARLWNAVVVPRVEDAIISRVTAKRSSSSSSPSLPRQSPSNCGLSAGQQAVVKAALSILVNKAVLLGCPLPRHGVCGCCRRWRVFIHVSSAVVSVGEKPAANKPKKYDMLSFPLCPIEIDRYLLEFRGGAFPLSAIGSYKESGGGRGRKGRDGSKLRRSNTSPRKKGSPALNWSCGGSFREGEMSYSGDRHGSQFRRSDILKHCEDLQMLHKIFK